MSKSVTNSVTFKTIIECTKIVWQGIAVYFALAIPIMGFGLVLIWLIDKL